MPQPYILVVEDDAGIRALIARTLTSDGFDVQEAGDGREALELIQQQPQSFSAIVLDVQMPVMDGRAFYREMRAVPCEAPVIVVSAVGAASARRELGADDWLEKPFDPFVLSERVAKLSGAWSGQDGQSASKVRGRP